MTRRFGLVLLSLIGLVAAIEPIQTDHIRRSLENVSHELPFIQPSDFY